MRRRCALAFLSLAVLAHADRSCPKCHERWPDRYLSCPMDGTRTVALKMAKPIATPSAFAFDAAFTQGLALFRSKRYAEAAALFAKAAVRRPDSAAPAYWQGRSLHAMDPLDTRPQNLWIRATNLDPTYAPPHNELGLLFEGWAGDVNLARAEAQFRKAIEIDPKFGPPLYNLAFLLESTHKEGKPSVEELYRRAVFLAPDDGMAHAYLGRWLYYAHQLDEAERELRLAVRLVPENAMAQYHFGAVLNRKNPNYNPDGDTGGGRMGKD